LKQPTGRAR